MGIFLKKRPIPIYAHVPLSSSVKRCLLSILKIVYLLDIFSKTTQPFYNEQIKVQIEISSFLDGVKQIHKYLPIMITDVCGQNIQNFLPVFHCHLLLNVIKTPWKDDWKCFDWK